MLSRDRWGQHPTYSRHSEALTIVRKALWRHEPTHMYTHSTASCTKSWLCSMGTFHTNLLFQIMKIWSILLHILHLYLLILLRMAPVKIWHQLSSVWKNWAWWGPMDSSTFNPFFCSGKPAEVINLNLKTARKLESHLKVKGIKARRGNRNYVALHKGSTSFPLSILGKHTSHTDTHKDMPNQHMLLTTQLRSGLCTEQKSRWTHLQPNTRWHTGKHAYFEPPRKHNSCSKHK